MYQYTDTQKNRLSELGADRKELEKEYESAADRQKDFQILEKKLAKKNKDHITGLLKESRRASLCTLHEDLAHMLCANGFTEIVTPTIISRRALSNMTITPDNPLYEQVFWIDSNQALRPMLAPNLYEVSRQLIDSQGLPLRVFEIGSCFRKESEGKSHLKEFTMLNLVEWGTPMEERTARLREFATMVMGAAGIEDYQLAGDDSVVYGEGIDVVGTDGLELASSSMGPHKLDDAWKITCTWVGIGFGLERLLMYRQRRGGIHAYSRSNTFLDGACLKVK